MDFKKFIIVFFISILVVGCQTIKEKTDAIAEKENREYGKLVGKNISDLKKDLKSKVIDLIKKF